MGTDGVHVEGATAAAVVATAAAVAAAAVFCCCGGYYYCQFTVLGSRWLDEKCGFSTVGEVEVQVIFL